MQTSFSNFISSSSFRRNSILRFIVCGQNPLKPFEGPTYRVTYSLLMCPYTSFMSSLVSWPISKKNISNFSFSIHLWRNLMSFTRSHKRNSNAQYFSWHELQKTLLRGLYLPKSYLKSFCDKAEHCKETKT